MTKTIKRMASDESAAESLYREAVARLAADPEADMHGIEAVLADAGRTRGDLEIDVDLLVRRRTAATELASPDASLHLAAGRLLRQTASPEIENGLDRLRQERQWLAQQAKAAELAFRSIGDLETKLTGAMADAKAAEIGGRGGNIEREKVGRLRHSLQKARDAADRGVEIGRAIARIDAEIAETERQKLIPERMRWSMRG